MVERKKIALMFKVARVVAILFMIGALIVSVAGFLQTSTIVSTYLQDAQCSLPQNICNLFIWLGFQEFMLDSKYFIWYTLLPMAAIAGFIYYFTKDHMGSGFAATISILIALASIPGGIVLAFDAVLLYFLGQYAFVGGIFLVSLWIGERIAMGWVGGVIRKEESALKMLEKHEKALWEERSKIVEALAKGNISGPVATQYNERLTKIDAELAKIRKKKAILAEHGIG